MKQRWSVWLVACVCWLPAPLLAQEKKSPEDPAHDELRALAKSLTEAVDKGDVEGQLKHVHPDAVVTWQNGEVVRGTDKLRDFFKENVAKQKIFQGYKQPPTPTDLTILHGGNTGISYGTSIGRYKILGNEFELKNHWTATLVKDGGQWKIASYHVSANILDNPVINTAKNWIYAVIGFGLVVGLLLGILIGRRTRK